MCSVNPLSGSVPTPDSHSSRHSPYRVECGTPAALNLNLEQIQSAIAVLNNASQAELNRVAPEIMAIAAKAAKASAAIAR